MQEIFPQKNSRNPLKRAGSSFHNIGDNKYVLIGGGNRSEEFDDVWELKILEEQQQEQGEDQNSKKLVSNWEKIEFKNKKNYKYSQRTGQASCMLGNNIYVFGGQNFHINKHFDDFLVYNFDSELSEEDRYFKDAQNAGFGPKSIINQPGERNSCTMTVDPETKKIYFFGGADPQEPLCDLYSYDTVSKVWMKLSPKQEKDWELVQPVEMHTLEFYCSNLDLTKINANKNKKKKANKKSKQQSQKIVDLGFGGPSIQEQQQQQQNLNEDQGELIAKSIAKVNIEYDPKNVVQVDEQYDTEAQKQIQRFEEQEIQIQKQEQQEKNQENNDNEEEDDEQQEEDQTKESAQDENKSFKYLISVGGRSQDKILDEIIAYNISENVWVKIKDLPTPLCAHASIIIQEKNELWIFGGTDGAQFLDTLLIYNFNNGKFYQLNIQDHVIKNKIYFGPRMACSITYNKSTDSVVIFGGSGYEDENSQVLYIDAGKNRQVTKL